MGARTLDPESRDGALTLRNFAGMNNIEELDRLGTSFVRAAVNMDFSPLGRARRRRGRKSVYSGGGIRSLWTDGADLALFAEGNALKRLRKIGGAVSTSTIFSGLSGVNRIAYCPLLGDVFFSDGVINRRLAGDTVRDWGVAAPVRGADVVLGAGAMSKGVYRVLLTHVSASGEESGESPMGQAAVAVNDSGLAITISVPPVSIPAVAQVRIYCTAANGTEFLYVGQVAAGVTSFALSQDPKGGRTLQTEHLSPMPPGSKIVYHRGRLFVADGPTLWYSEPMRYSLTRLSNFFSFPADIQMLGANESALFVVADKSYSLSGATPEQFVQDVQLPYSGPDCDPVRVPGSIIGEFTKDEAVVWMSHRGLCAGLPSGQIVNLTEKRVAVPEYDRAALMYQERAGIRQVVSSSPAKGTSAGLAVGDQASGEVRRNGVFI